MGLKRAPRKNSEPTWVREPSGTLLGPSGERFGDQFGRQNGPSVPSWTPIAHNVGARNYRLGYSIRLPRRSQEATAGQWNRSEQTRRDSSNMLSASIYSLNLDRPARADSNCPDVHRQCPPNYRKPMGLPPGDLCSRSLGGPNPGSDLGTSVIPHCGPWKVTFVEQTNRRKRAHTSTCLPAATLSQKAP